MDVANELDQLRADLAGVSIVAFADLSSQLVLRASSETNRPQEELTALSQAAQLTLDGGVAEGALPVWNGDADAPAQTAILMTEADIRVFLRSPAKATEALVFVCAPDAAIPSIVESGQASLARLVAEG